MLARQQAQEAFLNICLTLIDNECWECKGPARLWNNTTASSWKVFHHSQMNFYISSRYLLKLGSPLSDQTVIPNNLQEQAGENTACYQNIPSSLPCAHIQWNWVQTSGIESETQKLPPPSTGQPWAVSVLASTGLWSHQEKLLGQASPHPARRHWQRTRSVRLLACANTQLAIKCCSLLRLPFSHGELSLSWPHAEHRRWNPSMEVQYYLTFKNSVQGLLCKSQSLFWNNSSFLCSFSCPT